MLRENPGPASISVPDATVFALSKFFRTAFPVPVRAAMGAGARTLLDNLRLDWRVVALLLVVGAPLALSVPSGTSDWQSLCFGGRKDEPAMVMALESMTVHPYGNSANYWEHPKKRPACWRYIQYTYWVYAQGIYYDLAFLVFAPLKWLGAPTFPVAPIILRILSLLWALGGLVLLYNYGKRYSGVFTAVFAAAVWATSAWILANAMAIHPDSIQVALTFLALHLAARHQRDGDIASLLAMGLVCGLQHSAKMGGFWLIPMALLALAWGWRASPSGDRRWRCVAARIGGLLVSAAVGFFVASPYTLVDGLYWRVMTASQAATRFQTVTPLSWAGELWKDQGWLLVSATAFAILFHLGKWAAGRANRPMVLAAVLGLSNLAWFAALGRLEVRIEWITPAFPVLALVLSDCLGQLVRAVRGASRPRAVAAQLLVGSICLVFLYERWSTFPIQLLSHVARRSPVPGNTERVRALVPPGSKILIDVSGCPSFDLQQYPDQINWGTPKYGDLWSQEPDYLILSENYLDHPTYKSLVHSQRLSVFDTNSFSVRLYQDLLVHALHPLTPGPTGVPGIELVGFMPTEFQAASIRPNLSLPPAVKRLLPTFAAELGETYRLAGELEARLRNSTYYTPPCPGNRFVVYRLAPAGGPNGRMSPICSGWLDVYKPAFAFDGNNSSWQSSDTGPEVEGRAFIGFDFGGGSKVAVQKAAVEWVEPWYTPAVVKVQYSDDGREWEDAGSFPTSVPANTATGPEQVIPLPDVGPHRAWRILAASPVPVGFPFAVYNIRFLDQQGVLVR